MFRRILEASMSKRIAVVLALLSIAVLCPLAARAQAPAEPQAYTYVSEWTLPRAQWSDWEAFGEKDVRPIFEKLMANGAIQSWGLYTTTLHVDGYPTHGSWFETADIASVYRALAALAKLPPNPIMNSPDAKHRDFLLHSQVRRKRAASGTNGYLWVNNTHLQPGKTPQYRALYEQFLKPVLDALVADGTLVMYAMDNETMHTDNPSQIFDVYFFAGPDGQDKLYAAILEMEKKNTTFADALNATEVGPPHRDYIARVLTYGVK
jgi:hypothetical protein